MRVRPVINLLGLVLLALGFAMQVCAVAAWAMGDPLSAIDALLISGAVSMAAGMAAWLPTRHAEELSRRDGFGVVTLGWIAASLAGAMPYVLSGVIPNGISAVFESMSGFTTTGASVIPVLETVPRGILLWRATTHLFGGMGVLVFVIAILPLVGTGGMQLFRAEMPGPVKDRLTPRIAGTAKRLWAVYVLLVAVETVLLRAGGLSWFESVCHSFATIATGGFSTRTASIGAYQSSYVDIVIVVFMALSGVNFALHYRALNGRLDSFWKDSEFKLYVLILFAAGIMVAVSLASSGAVQGLGRAVRGAFFAVVSILTTTGFVTEDFDRWPAMARIILFLLMFVGGCAGSTGGSIKVIRILLVLRSTGREVRRWLRPQAVMSLKVDRQAVEPEMVMNVMAFVLLYGMIFAGSTVVMTLHFHGDWVSSASSVAATLGNIGPGFHAVGPTLNYASVPPPLQAFLSLLMLLGRLEMYTVLVLFMPSFWRR